MILHRADLSIYLSVDFQKWPECRLEFRPFCIGRGRQGSIDSVLKETTQAVIRMDFGSNQE